METVGILWAGVAVIVAAAVVQNLQGAAQVRDEWREWCRHDTEEQERKRVERQRYEAQRAAERERYEEGRRMEREAFYAGHHSIKPDGWTAPNVVTVDRREHEKLMDWRGW